VARISVIIEVHDDFGAKLRVKRLPFAACDLTLIAQCSTCVPAPFSIGATNGDHNRLQHILPPTDIKLKLNNLICILFVESNSL
jgi:hypothetical protein